MRGAVAASSFAGSRRRWLMKRPQRLADRHHAGSARNAAGIAPSIRSACIASACATTRHRPAG